MRLGRGAWLAAMVVSTWCAEVRAQGEPAADAAPASTADDDEKARELFKQGDEHYKNGRYEEALAALKEAYELSGRTALLFNMANALEKLGRYQEALNNLEAFAPHAPEARKQEIAERIATLREKIERAKPPPEPPPPEPPRPEPPPPSTPAPVGPPPISAPSPPAPVPDQPDETPVTATAGYVLLGVGGAGLVLGAILGGMALSARGDAEAQCEASATGMRCLADAQDALDDDKTFSLVADVGFGVGIVAALTGGALVIYSLLSEPSEPTVSIAVAGGGLLVRGRF